MGPIPDPLPAIVFLIVLVAVIAFALGIACNSVGCPVSIQWVGFVGDT